jgi:predicted RNA-binding Zn-ribbon protein involved in translation (DUF1610 family)
MVCPSCEKKIYDFEQECDVEFNCPHCGARLLLETGDVHGLDRLVEL